MNTIGLATTLSGNGLNQYFLEVFKGVIEAAAAAGQNTTAFVLPDWQDRARRIPTLCDGRIDGLILLAPLLDDPAAELLPAHTRFVSVHSNQPPPGVVNLESDEEAGAFATVQLMLALGHRRPHLVGLGGVVSGDAGLEHPLAVSELHAVAR